MANHPTQEPDPQAPRTTPAQPGERPQDANPSVDAPAREPTPDPSQPEDDEEGPAREV